jgi:hypothetical protein
MMLYHGDTMVSTSKCCAWRQSRVASTFPFEREPEHQSTSVSTSGGYLRFRETIVYHIIEASLLYLLA